MVSLLLFFSALGKARHPNFIIIIGDDVGWDAFGCTGMKEARTPAIDKLANESCMMTRFY
ncbi:MAG: sulfatase-like hydrolase/transferase, partial [Opitutae bacterium]|nr:sulfatase-like hydrolase/transferase [Opitutae bacterium]